MDENARTLLAQLLEWIGVIAVAIWVISFAVRSAMKHGQPQRRGETWSASKAMAALDNTPGMFLIVGVDRSTGMDVREHIRAETPANAQAKAEMKGITVTAIRRIGD